VSSPRFVRVRLYDYARAIMGPIVCIIFGGLQASHVKRSFLVTPLIYVEHVGLMWLAYLCIGGVRFDGFGQVVPEVRTPRRSGVIDLLVTRRDMKWLSCFCFYNYRQSRPCLSRRCQSRLSFHPAGLGSVGRPKLLGFPSNSMLGCSRGLKFEF
jgi:hypothetical protein